MRHPQLIIRDSDGWMSRQLGELAAESRWLVREPKSRDTALSLARDPRPSALFVRVEPAEAATDAYSLIADAHRLSPDVPVVAVSDVKLPDADRIAWTAVLFDLGARYVLFPPLSKTVLEDLASGLMATARRALGEEPLAPGVEDPIDLADEPEA